ncbi:MAG: FKBP-type peptidyl-prolyl cis-trans isomerase [Polyangiales bacterium]
MKVAPGCVVRIEYEIRIDGGEVLETSAKTGPLQYTHGGGRLLPALEKRMEGMSAGQSIEGVIPSAEAFPEDALPTKAIPRKEFPEGEVEVGSMFAAHTEDGGAVNLKVLSVDERSVTVRMLPAIAGKDIAYKVKVVMIEDPKANKREVVAKRPPPPPAEALKVDVEVDEG